MKPLNPSTAGSARTNAQQREKKESEKSKEKKRIEAQRVKHPTPPQAIDAHMGEERTKETGSGPPIKAIDALTGQEEQKEKQKKETGSGPPTQIIII